MTCNCASRIGCTDWHERR